ncbi:MAG: hypothetical protein JNL05_03575 [Flavobacteriales bacterium]|nr:hypothetical protein [Flavobacteriales bacterium]
MRTHLIHAVVAGVLAAIAAIIYLQVYSAALAVDFSSVANPMGAAFSTLIGVLLAGLGRHFWGRWVKRGTEVSFNAIFTVLTFASIAPVFGMTLPLTVEAPELFIGMVVPTHLFPQLFWHVSSPLFEPAQA